MIEYNHPKVISDFREALCLMCPDIGDDTHRFLRSEPANARRVFIFSKHNGRPMRSEYPVANKVFQTLIRSIWTEPTFNNQIFDRTRLVISNSGTHAYRSQFHEELVISALANLATSTNEFQVFIHLMNRTYWFVAEKPERDLPGRTLMPRIFMTASKRRLIEPAPPRLDNNGKPLTFPSRFQISSLGKSYIDSIRQQSRTF